MAREFVLYGGRKFWLQTTGRYFQSGVKTDPERLLHRQIWIDNFGPIPAGFEVHHKDEDWRNNDPLNLELKDGAGHRSHHAKKRWEDPTMAAKMRAGLANAIKAAPAWHATDAGREWHRQNSVQAWKKKDWHLVGCTVCKAEYRTPFPDRSLYCTKACENTAVRARHQEPRTCLHCGKEFSAFKYGKAACCSRTCAQQRRWANRAAKNP